jgi:uncharacterized membrane protein
MSIFEFFFKYKPLIYQKGKLAFLLVGSKWWFLPVSGLAIAGAVYFYRNVSREKRSRGMVALRALTFVTLAFMLMRPILNVSTVLPQESYMAVVIDNSESMNIKDDGTKARSEELKEQLEKTSFMKRLADKFKIRVYRFDKEAERIERPDELTYTGKRTRMESATDLLRQELGTVPLAGVVLISDGADNASAAFAESLAKLESKHIPFYTVGVGADQITHDAEIIKVSAPREMLKESTAVVDVSIRSHGFSRKKASIRVSENGKALKAEEIVLPGDGEIVEKSIDLQVKNVGPRVFSFSLQVADDRIPENNTMDSLINVRDDHPRVLYVEGEPRWEFKFIRRALEDDTNVHLVTFLRSSQNKFYRQGIDEESELADGFPKKKEDLYKYKALIFGSVESTFFTQDQLNMVVDYVTNRGGGFMMLGGRNSFSGGRYENSPIAPILPVQLGSDRTPILDKIKMLTTEYGRTHTLMKLTPDADANVKQWSELPPLGDLNKTLDQKAGAVVLARGQPESGSDSPILLAFQRYGRGRTMAFTTSNSWAWQMQMDSKDQTHELFWRQIMRWLVNGSPDPVTVTTDKDTYLPGEVVNIDAEVSDKSFNRMNGSRVTVKLTDPSGKAETMALDWSGEQDGSYHGQIVAGAEGVYQLQVDANQGDQNLGSYKTAFQTHDRPVEYYNAALDAGALRSIASQTDGHYYPLAKLGDVPDDAIYTDGESSFIEQRELWDVPFLFMLLCASFGTEWLWRKKKGLA